MLGDSTYTTHDEVEQAQEALEQNVNQDEASGIDEGKQEEEKEDEDDTFGAKVIQPKQDEAYYKYRKEIPILLEKCENGDPQSCLTYASYYENAMGVTQNLAIAERYYTQVCRFTHNAAFKKKGCGALERFYANRLGIEALYKKGLQVIQGVCNNGDGKACALLGSMLEHQPKINYKSIMNAYEKACKKDVSFGCYKLGFMNEQGLGVTKSVRVAVDYYYKACKADAFYCDKMYDLQKWESGIEWSDYSLEDNQSYDTNACIYGNNSYACHHGNDDSCFMLERACELDDPQGCVWLAGQQDDGLCETDDEGNGAEFYYKKARALGSKGTY